MKELQLSLPIADDDTRNRNMPLFLGLFLLILAFFILLVSMSTIKEDKTSAVIGSLSSTFSRIAAPFMDPSNLSSMEGLQQAGQEFQDHITGIFSSSLQVATVEVLKPGKILQVELPLQTLFAEGDTVVRPVVIPILDRIIASLGNRPIGIKYDLEFVMGTPVDKNGETPVTQGIELARLGSFARELLRRGAPPDSISVGLVPGVKDKATIFFYIRSIDDGILELIGSTGPGTEREGE